jgi:hypothetical protein
LLEEDAGIVKAFEVGDASFRCLLNDTLVLAPDVELSCALRYRAIAQLSARST